MIFSLIVNNSPPSGLRDCRNTRRVCRTVPTSERVEQRRFAHHHMLFCLDYRLREPVNYVRANWIRPEDLYHYEALGFRTTLRSWSGTPQQGAIDSREGIFRAEVRQQLL